MKKLSCLILLLLSALNYAQTEINLGENDKLIYLDSTYREVTKENHKYFRIIKDYYIDKPEYKFLDYYKNNRLKEDSAYKNKDGGAPIGDKINYYENGNKQSVITYDNGKPIGKATTWYENGNIKEEGEYIGNNEIPEMFYKLNQYWDINKNQLIVNGNGFYTCGEKNSFQETGTYKNGYKDGVFEGKNLNGSNTYSEIYKNGKFIFGTTTLENGTKIDYYEIFIQPVPEKGIKDFYDYIGKHYSTRKIPSGLKGKVLISFIVEKDGEIYETEIIRDVGYGSGEEAVRVLKKYGKWLPGKHRGHNIRCHFTIPINIQSAN